MSKASEYLARMKAAQAQIEAGKTAQEEKLSFEFGSLKCSVGMNGLAVLELNGYQLRYIEAAELQALAAWIADTFGEPDIIQTNETGWSQLGKDALMLPCGCYDRCVGHESKKEAKKKFIDGLINDD